MMMLNAAKETSQYHNLLETPEKVEEKDMDSDSLKLWKALHECFDFFNDELFGGRLDRNKIVLNCARRGRALGFFWPGTWADENGAKAEISLNPDYMSGRSIEKIMSTFVHEMCHYEQDLFGSPGKRAYHNKEWADMMAAVGLLSYNVKDPRKNTGMSCSHTIEENGRFAKAMERMPEAMKLPFLGMGQGKRKAKTGYCKWFCPECGQIVRAKPSAQIACGECSDDISLVLFVRSRKLSLG